MGKYTGSVATSQRQQIAFDDALAESDRKKVGNVMRWVKELKSLSKYIQVFIK